MAYTDVWDVTAPLDTQAANQGAADFRATKLDVMQRIASFGAGILANRPTPESTSATADWTGVMYWATDTNQCFRWNGTSWDDISVSLPSGGSSFVDLTTIVRSSPNPIGADQLENNVTLLADTLAVGNVITIIARFNVVNVSPSNASADVSLVVGGNTIATLSPADTNGNYSFQCQLAVVNLTTMRGLLMLGTGPTSIDFGLPSITVADLSVNTLLVGITKTISGTAGHTNNNTFTFDYLTVVKN